jgi:carboxypeptidase T
MLQSLKRSRVLALGLTVVAAAIVLSPTADVAAQPILPTSSAQSVAGVSIYWVSFGSTEALNALVANYDVLETRQGNEVQVIGDAAVVARLRSAGYGVRLAQSLTPLGGNDGSTSRVPGVSGAAAVAATFFGGYRTKAEQYAHLDSVTAANPSLVVGYTYGSSWRKANGLGGNDLRVLCITKLQPGDCQLNPNSAKPRSLVMASIHARELTPAELAYRYVDLLVGGYGTNADITAILDSTEVWIIPVANPDGREIVELGGNAPYLQRKNANNSIGVCSNPPTVSNQAGVDLNRNANFQWGGVGTTTDPCAQTYKGVSAASEPEQQALQTLWASLWPDQHLVPTDAVATTATGTFLSVHSSSNFVLLPPGAGGTSANDAQLRALAFRFSSFNGYVTGTGPEILYGTTGTSDDYVYHELGPASFTFEVGPTAGTCSGFTPVYSCVDSSFWPLNKDAFLYAAKTARSPYVSPRGPSTVNPVAATAVQGNNALLNATINDAAYGNAVGSIGRPLVRNVQSAEYFVDVAPWAGGTAIPMIATDSLFNTGTESVTASIPTGSLSVGRHLIYVRGTNDAGFTGPVTAAFLDVTPVVTTSTTSTTTPTTTTTTPTTTTSTTTTTVLTTTTTVPTPTALLADSFSSGAGNWTPVSGSWSIVTDGTPRYQGFAGRNATSLSVAGSTGWTNYELATVAKVSALSRGTGGPALYLRYSNSSNYYAVQWNGSRGRWQIVRVQNGQTVVLATSAVTSLAFNTNITLSAVASGSSLSLSVNGTLAVSVTDATFGSGSVGLGSTSATVRYDDVTVTSR